MNCPPGSLHLVGVPDTRKVSLLPRPGWWGKRWREGGGEGEEELLKGGCGGVL